MITIKIQFPDGHVNKYDTVPESWRDITFNRMADVLDLLTGEKQIEPIQLLSTITGIPVDDLNQVDAMQVQQLSNMCSFVTDIEDLQQFATVHKSFEKYLDIKVQFQTFEKIEQAKTAYQKTIESGRHPFSCCRDLVEIYTGEDIGERPVPEVWGLCSFFLTNWVRSSKGSNA